ncbi:unnamed protein product [Bursaphelenchus xylophilus]|uniref:(pine wood nematode) hypothetical protein n=1 Tax=Bursaphelenchus xylophilus TaxID=6326 RepID=A0A1I7SIG1_BURXY|nr:unnamed protein product [Bursaphelenchus xylophilus]CAG9130226.1 unnamed protein product [Bursaphelenchus xylophilus]
MQVEKKDQDFHGCAWLPKVEEPSITSSWPKDTRFMLPQLTPTTSKKDMGTQTELGNCFDARHAYLDGYMLLPISVAALSPGLPPPPRSAHFSNLATPNSASSTGSKNVFDFNLKSLNIEGFGTSPLVSPTEPRRKGSHMFCGFCFNNAKANGIDTSGPGRWSQHNLRDQEGRVECPCLRMFQCPICGASGDSAHTQRHCPKRNRI